MIGKSGGEYSHGVKDYEILKKMDFCVLKE